LAGGLRSRKSQSSNQLIHGGNLMIALVRKINLHHKNPASNVESRKHPRLSLGKERSLTYIREVLRSLAAKKLVLCVVGHSILMPRVYTLTRKGREFASVLLGTPTASRFRPSDERDKGHNPYFLQHTLAVSDILVAAQLLAQTIPGISLARLFTERALRRKIAVPLPGTPQPRIITIAPDASCGFLIHKAWQAFVHIEVYRNLPPVQWRFQQKVQGYVAYALSGQHEELFDTPSLSIAVITHTTPMATTLKRWTEEALRSTTQAAHGELFFFRSIADTATAKYPCISTFTTKTAWAMWGATQQWEST
jgi:Replication-relaxation